MRCKSNRLRDMRYNDLTDSEKEKCWKLCEQWKNTHSLPGERKLSVKEFFNDYIRFYGWDKYYIFGLLRIFSFFSLEFHGICPIRIHWNFQTSLTISCNFH